MASLPLQQKSILYKSSTSEGTIGSLSEMFDQTSMIRINKKRNKDNRERMSHPLVVEQATCMLSRAPFNVNMHVLEVQ